jgi:hypothetical protein
MLIIGIGHRRHRGKDTFANFLYNCLSDAGYYTRKASFAGALKQHIGKGLFGLEDWQVNGDGKEIIDRYWQMTPRAILQRAGTECFRDVFGKDFWVKCLFRELTVATKYHFALITDVRFMSEVEAIKKANGYLIRVDRPLIYDPITDDHPSEQELVGYAGWDKVIDNAGSIEDLMSKALAASRFLQEVKSLRGM